MHEASARGSKGLASVIIICRDELPYLEQTIRFMLTVPSGCPMEIIVVDDGSRDGCADFLRRGGELSRRVHLVDAPGLGPARARNLGAARARGELLVFCDAHIIVPGGWLGDLARAVLAGQAHAVCPALVHTENPHLAIYGGTLNKDLSWVGLTLPPRSLSPVPLAPAGCLAVSREVFLEVGGFEEGFTGWGYDDVEFSLKLWLFGFVVAVMPWVKVIHISRPLKPYQRPGENLTRNLLLLAALHFNPHRLARVAAMARSYAGFSEAWARASAPGVLKKRDEYFRRRVHDDDWFVNTFGMPV
ncbi:glycosyl transferase family 2 [Desulfofundulus kuznetsovii DSM 6115]|uniref:Glycosyl transferase family 2 n=1 Tax=Desulfofundulus kuznetsovii (strain DSM 6115 / VKM B-1805 / 17) TaxID=760568 RepID=A0AAU8Q6X8_DESK7|nr:glycosyl transferase family 2 [Desulfofundulus kuznetsovii DSM 6115]